MYACICIYKYKYINIFQYVGWGACGICPGPGLVAFAARANPSVVPYFIPSMVAGMMLKDVLFSAKSSSANATVSSKNR